MRVDSYTRKRIITKVWGANAPLHRFFSITYEDELYFIPGLFTFSIAIGKLFRNNNSKYTTHFLWSTYTSDIDDLHQFPLLPNITTKTGKKVSRHVILGQYIYALAYKFGYVHKQVELRWHPRKLEGDDVKAPKRYAQLALVEKGLPMWDPRHSEWLGYRTLYSPLKIEVWGEDKYKRVIHHAMNPAKDIADYIEESVLRRDAYYGVKYRNLNMIYNNSKYLATAMKRKEKATRKKDKTKSKQFVKSMFDKRGIEVEDDE